MKTKAAKSTFHVLMVRKKQIGNSFVQNGKKLDGLTAVQEKNAQVTVEQGSHLVRSLVHLRNVEQVRREQRFGTSEDQRSIGA